MEPDTSDIPLDRAKLRGRSRCDLCGRRIWPSRYALGLCPRCESLVSFAHAQYLVAAMYRLLRDPTLIEKIEKSSKAFADAIRLCVGE